MELDKKNKPIRLGVVGSRRGKALAASVKDVGMEVVAFCDFQEDKVKQAAQEYNCSYYTDFDKFLEHDMDAVILANYFHQHAPFAIKALEAGLHVMSETSVCKTLGEGVALVRAVEKSGKIYMLAENYAYFSYIQEMKRLYNNGEIGEFMYGEGEYMHPMSAYERNKLAPGVNHWRNHIPAPYYSTHALSPLMYVTETRPISVNAQCIPYFQQDKENLHVRRTDLAYVIICKMSNGSIVRLLGNGLRGKGNWYRMHGTRGLMENMRWGDRNSLRIVHDEWDLNSGDIRDKVYTPEFPIHSQLAKKTGHAGSDFFVNYYFAQAIRTGEQPFFDIYRGLDMTLTGIIAYKSSLENGAPFEIPDFRSESVRAKYENDDWSPFPEDRRQGQPWPSVTGEIIPSEEAMAYAKQIWEEMGF